MQGDLLLVNHGTIFDDAVGIGQEALTLTEPELKGYTWCRHTGVIRYQDGKPWVSEMGPRGYERRPIDGYDHELYAVVNFDASAEQRLTAMKFDEACSDVDYGWFEYFPLVIDGLTAAKFAGSWGDAIICSTHVTLVLMGLGAFPDRPPDAVTPAHWALWTGANPENRPQTL